MNKAREKIERLLKNVEELQQSDSDNQLQARRAERELREEREKVLRMERELDGWKVLRADRGSVVGRAVGAFSDVGSRRGSDIFGGDTSQRKVSNTKGFL